MIVAGSAPAKRYTIVGIIKFGGGQSFGGAGVALLIPAEAQRMAGEQGRFDQIDVAARPGVTPDPAARPRSARSLPPAVEVRTGAQQAAPRDLRTGKRPELPAHVPAGLRLRRAGRRRVHHLQHLLDHGRPAHARVRAAAHAWRLAAQIMRSVVVEGLLLGVVGAALGLLGGHRARACARPAVQGVRRRPARQRHRARDAHDRRVAARGHVVTVLAGLPPALRATRVPPLAAMREGVEIPPRASERR